MSTSHAMASADAAWLHMDRPTNLDGHQLRALVRRPVDRDRSRGSSPSASRALPPLPAAGRKGPPGPHWEDDELDLDLHLHHLAPPAPGDRTALQDVRLRSHRHPLDRSRPLWEAYLIDGYGEGAALLTRMHHCIADGIALARVMLALTDGGPAEPARLHRRVRGGLPLARLVRSAGALAHEAVEVVRHPAHAVAGTVEDAATLAKLLLPGADPRTAIRSDQRISHHVGWCDPLDLWRVKQAARALGATVNDVLVSAVTGALAGHLQASGDVPDELHALVPFNLRPLDEPLPRELGNRFGLVLLALPVGVADPVLRTIEVKRRMDAIKHGHEGPISYGILELMGRTPAASKAA